MYVHSENSKWQTLLSFQANSCQVASVVVIYAILVSNLQFIFNFQVYVHSENAEWLSLRRFLANSCQEATVAIIHDSLV